MERYTPQALKEALSLAVGMAEKANHGYVRQASADRPFTGRNRRCSQGLRGKMGLRSQRDGKIGQ